MPTNPQYDQEQLGAIRCDGHTLVSACPGAGKTLVLAERSARLLSENSRGKLVAVTFTRDAAHSLRSRIIKSAGENSERRVASGTFHALALQQLKATRKQRLRVLSSNEQRMLLTRAWKQAGRLYDFAFDRLDEAEEALEAVKASMAPPPSPRSSATGALYVVYQDLLEQAGAVDFPDLLRMAVDGMTRGEIEPMDARWMLVDEAQDMDEVQYAWIRCHMDAGSEVMCVADDDQSIYQWRHALGYEGLMQFKREAHAAHLVLPVNHRCRPEILLPAAKLIEHNPNRVEKSIRPARAPGGTVAVLENDDRHTECTRLINHVLEYGHAGWAVLARTNRVLDALDAHLSAYGVPYKRIGGTPFWKSPAPSAYLSILKSVADNDPIALLQAATWAGVFSERDADIAQGENAKDILDRLSRNHIKSNPPITARAARQMRRMYGDWAASASSGRPNLAIFGAAEWLKESLDKRYADVLDLCANVVKGLDGPLPRRIAAINARRHSTRNKSEMLLMTMHAAKGLEFPSVWVMGCEEGAIPHKDGVIEEERRLFYVAMTRAEETLVLSYAPEEGTPSRFISEAGLSDLTATTLPEVFEVES